MHRVSDQLVRGFRVAADQRHLYFRFDGLDLVRRLLAADIRIVVLQHQPRADRLELHGSSRGGYDPGPRWRAVEVVTAAVPFTALGARAGDAVSLSILLTDQAGHVIEQHPAGEPLIVFVPTPGHDAERWVV
jgi:hypothetical protein